MFRHLSRRGFLVSGTAATLATVATIPTVAGAAAGTPGRSRAAFRQGTPAEVTGPYELPPLPYDVAALEPAIDAQTMEIHHGKHHQAYVDNLNKAVADLPDIAGMPVEELIQQLDLVPEEKRTAVRNNGGGHANHTMFWETMTPGGGEPAGALADAITATFGDLAAMQEMVNTAGLGRFGSGWAWLIVNPAGELEVTSTPNQDNPLMGSLVETPGTPILGVDVWEHAYYLAYQNRRADYLAAWWGIVNWETVGRRYEQATGQ
jgi:Fe-Mn family superoxide dismutase